MIEEVARDLYRVDIPLLGNPLKSINFYILKGQDRNLIIDTGMNRVASANELVAFFWIHHLGSA
jgi:hypothetical protein